MLSYAFICLPALPATQTGGRNAIGHPFTFAPPSSSLSLPLLSSRLSLSPLLVFCPLTRSPLYCLRPPFSLSLSLSLFSLFSFLVFPVFLLFFFVSRNSLRTREMRIKLETEREQRRYRVFGIRRHFTF